MKKNVLRKLAALRDLKEKIHNQWVDSHYENELLQKHHLIHKVFKNLEETQRGKLKSNIPYETMADCILENAEKFSYKELYQVIMNIALSRDRT